MSAASSARLVRRWVRFYTQGLPADVRDARREEIESDLWSHQDDNRPEGRSDGSLAIEILLRLAFGIPNDIAWRMAHAAAARPKLERRASMGSRLVGLVAVLGGISFTLGGAVLVRLWLDHPEANPWWRLKDDADPALWTVFSIGAVLGIIFFGAATVGLITLFQDQLGAGAALAGVVGGVIGVLGLGAPPLSALLPIGSAIVVWELARLRLMGWPLAMVFIASAVAYLFPLIHLGGPSRFDATILILFPYALAWVAIGAWSIRGVPRAESAATSA